MNTTASVSASASSVSSTAYRLAELVEAHPYTAFAAKAAIEVIGANHNARTYVAVMSLINRLDCLSCGAYWIERVKREINIFAKIRRAMVAIRYNALNVGKVVDGMVKTWFDAGFDNLMTRLRTLKELAVNKEGDITVIGEEVDNIYYDMLDLQQRIDAY